LGQWAPSLDVLTTLQQLQALSIIADGSEEQVVSLQQRLPAQLQRLTLIWWPLTDAEVQWREPWPLLQLQQLTGVMIHAGS
jgi:hypothetical protein